MSKKTRGKPQLKRAATLEVVNLQLRTAFRHLADLGEDTEVTIQWFEDGSGIARIYFTEIDKTMVMLDYEGTKDLCLELFGGYPQQTEETIWTDKDMDRLWAEFKRAHGLPEDAPYIAALSAELQDQLIEPWTAVIDKGSIIIFRKDEGGAV